MIWASHGQMNAPGPGVAWHSGILPPVFICAGLPPGATNEPMEKTTRIYASHREMKADEYRYRQSRPAHERLDAVEEMIQTAYALKGWEMEPDVPRLQRPVVRLPCHGVKYLIVGGYA